MNLYTLYTINDSYTLISAIPECTRLLFSHENHFFYIFLYIFFFYFSIYSNISAGSQALRREPIECKKRLTTQIFIY